MHTPRSTGWSGVPKRLAVGALLAGLACSKPAPQPITWEPDRRVAGAAAPGATMVLLDGGIPAMQQAWTPVRWPDDIRACKATYVGARGRGDTVYAAWRTGGDSLTTTVQVARSVNAGIAWSDAMLVGGAAPSYSGCVLPPPGLAVDSVSGTVHIVFYSPVVSARGVVYSTAPRNGGRFATPVLIVQGARPVQAAVAANSDTVAVVFESPTMPEGAMRLALFLGASHIPAIRLALSDTEIRAFAPAVAVRQGRIGAAWNEARHGTDGPAAVARVGRWTR